MISVRLESTNNPKILKFVANKTLTSGSYEFKNVDEAKPSAVAQQLFYLPFVKTVYITANFIAIERYDIAEWEEIADTVKEKVEELLNKYPDIITQTKEDKEKPKAVSMYLEVTPNPNVMKLVSNNILIEGILEYKTKKSAKNSPLASKILDLPYVKEVFISDNYISITKQENEQWEEISMELRDEITQLLRNGTEVLNEVAQELRASKADLDGEMKSDNDIEADIQDQEIEAPQYEIPAFENLGALEQKIVSILEEYIKPAVASDGGNISFIEYSYEDKKVKVLLQGACSGCPSSTATLQNGVQNIFHQMMPNEVNIVEAVNG